MSYSNDWNNGALLNMLYADTRLNSCLWKIPENSLHCSRSSQCISWANQNCTPGDLHSLNVYCDMGGYCRFADKFSTPAFHQRYDDDRHMHLVSELN